MKASTAILIAMLIVILVFIFYAIAKDPSWVRKSYWLANFIESPWEVYRRSDGTFDDAARLALQRATSRVNPTPAENLLAATVITHNILGQEHRPARGLTGAPTQGAIEQARLRRNMYDRARGHYMAALEGLHPRRQAAPARATLLNQETEMILAAAADFAFGGVAGLLANDPVLAAMLAEDWDFNANLAIFEGFEGGPAGFFIIDRPLAARASQLREEVVETRRAVAREAAAEQGGARGAAVDAYATLATQNTNDLQNSHDTSVLACLKAVVARLRADQGSLGALPTVDEVITDIHQVGDALSEGRPSLVADAVAVAERTKAGDRVVALDVTDEECLRRVWHRADDPRNGATRAQLRQAIFDNLVDAWEEGIGSRNIACVNGRTTRILSALVLLDWDKRNWDVKRLEQFKNDIFDRAHVVIMTEAAAAAASDDPDRQKAGKLYLAKTAEALRAVGPVPDAVTEQLAQEMRDAISHMVDRYVDELENDLGAKGAIPAPQIEMTKMEAMAAVG